MPSRVWRRQHRLGGARQASLAELKSDIRNQRQDEPDPIDQVLATLKEFKTEKRYFRRAVRRFRNLISRLALRGVAFDKLLEHPRVVRFMGRHSQVDGFESYIKEVFADASSGAAL